VDDWKSLVITQLDNFHFIQHTPLNSTMFLYSRNIKNNLKHQLSSLKDLSFELTRVVGVSFPFLLFGYLNPYLILIEMIRFLFGLFFIIEIN
jgi:hypothetical protein